MAQLSRPYQIALAAIALLGLVWVIALRGHGSSPSEPAPPTPAATHSSPAPNPATPTRIYHGPAPGVEGLTRDIAKAHEAVGASQRDAQRFEHQSAQAQSGGSPTAAKTGSKASSAPAHRSVPPARTVSTSSQTKPGASATNGLPVQQVAVERDLARHKTVLIVFWNPKSILDAKVRHEASGVANGSKGGVVVYYAHPDQVGLFGPVTEVSHVYQTPTILIINAHGLVSTLTGLTDTFALRQAVRETQHAK